MTKASRNFAYFLLAVGLNFCALSLLATNALAQSSLENPPGILMAATEQGIRYLTGGVGSEEREAMESWSADFNLKLIFAKLSGNYIADVGVDLIDQHGKELGRIITTGPWLYVQLPPGTYVVNAAFERQTKKIENLQLPKTQKVIRFIHWGEKPQ